ncbi:MAG: hypothetical protein M1827_000336 [Pycnora praestabilis]|nr:MAG: hypothetical protein M1827_000336 [Pycnora praestabilis]
MSGKSPGKRPSKGDNHATDNSLSKEGGGNGDSSEPMQVGGEGPSLSSLTSGRTVKRITGEGDSITGLRIEDFRHQGLPVRQQAQKSKEERRPDPQATAIPKPGNRFTSTDMGNKAYTGLFQPQNSLTREPFQTGPSGLAKSVLKNGLQGQKRRRMDTLDTTRVVGDNVPSNEKAFDLHSSYSGGRMVKKQKTTFNTTSPDGSIQVIDDDVMNGRSQIKNPHPTQSDALRRPSNAPSVMSLGSEIGHRASRPLEGVQEYKGLERMMSGSSRHERRSASRINEHNGGYYHNGITGSTQESDVSEVLVPQEANTGPILIDLLEENSQEKPESSYKGTLNRKIGKAEDGLSETLKRQLTDKNLSSAITTLPREFSTNKVTYESGDVMKEQLSQLTLETSKEPSAKDDIHAPEAVSIETPQLRNRYHRPEGISREQLVLESPDELQGDTIIGVRVHSFKKGLTSHLDKPTRRESSPQKTPNTKASAISEITKESSIGDIKTTNFLSSSGKRKGKDLVDIPSRKKVTRPQSWGLTTFRNGQELLSESNYAGLEHQKSTNDFNVVNDGIDLSQTKSEYLVRSKTVIRIFCSTDGGPKVQLTMCQNGTRDNRIDAEFTSEKDANEFVRVVQDIVPGCKITNKSSQQMDAIFAKRESERRSLNPYTNGVNNEKEMELLTRRTERAKAREHNEERSTNGQKAADRVSSMLSARFGKSPDKPKSAADISEHPELKIESSGVLTGNLSGTRSRGKSLRSHDPSPRRSPPLNIQALLEAQAQRFSRTVGFGPKWDKPLVFPPQGSKKTTIDFHDLDRLDEGEFLNDNIISFYLRYLEHTLQQERPDLAKKVYFFNSFFYASLTNSTKGKRGVNYELVQRWTSKVDIFNYDYIVVPINESAHWYVSIICNLPNLDGNLHQDGLRSSSPHPEIDKTFIIPVDSANDLHEPLISVKGSNDTSTTISSETDNKKSMNKAIPLNTSKAKDSLAAWSPYFEQKSVVELVGECEPEEDEAEGSWPSSDENEFTASPLKHTPSVPVAKGDPNSDTGTSKIEGVKTDVQSVQKESLRASRKGKKKPAPPRRRYSPEDPIIITLDSLGLAHSPTIRNLKDYLFQEGKFKRQLDVKVENGMTAKAIPLQQNYCDCGLFLLGYVEKFLQDPQGFVNKVLLRTMDEEKDWPEMDASKMRVRIRELVVNLHQEQKEGRKEFAKKTGHYHNRKGERTTGQPAPAEGALKKVGEVTPGGPLDITAEQNVQKARNKALNSATNVDQPRGATGREMTENEKAEKPKPVVKATTEKAPETQEMQEDSLVVTGSRPVDHAAERKARKDKLSRQIPRSPTSNPQDRRTSRLTSADTDYIMSSPSWSRVSIATSGDGLVNERPITRGK